MTEEQAFETITIFKHIGSADDVLIAAKRLHRAMHAYGAGIYQVTGTSYYIKLQPDGTAQVLRKWGEICIEGDNWPAQSTRDHLVGCWVNLVVTERGQ